MKGANAWRRVAWQNVDSAATRQVLSSMEGMSVLPREVTPQESAEFRQFLDKYVEWPVLDHRTFAPGMAWRDRRGRARPNAELPAGLKNWDPKELFRDIATPAVVAPMLSPGLSKHIGIYTEGSATRPETLVGALVYRVLDNNVGEFFAVSTAPSHRRRDLATLMLLAMLEDMRAQGCEVCQASIPSADHVSKPWLVQWLESAGFEMPERPTRSGVDMFNTTSLESSAAACSYLGLDDDETHTERTAPTPDTATAASA